MKYISRCVLTIFIGIPLLTMNAAFANDFETNSPNGVMLETQEQIKAQVGFFKQALDEFGATSPEQVINVWVKSEQTRNGVYHYAVACDDLKHKIIEKLGEPKEYFWIYGASSPWFDRYEIVSKRKLSESGYEIKIKFFWKTSSGDSRPTFSTLTIVKNKDIWCVKEVK